MNGNGKRIAVFSNLIANYLTAFHKMSSVTETPGIPITDVQQSSIVIDDSKLIIVNNSQINPYGIIPWDSLMKNRTNGFRRRFFHSSRKASRFVFCGKTCFSSFARGFMMFLHCCLLVSYFQGFGYCNSIHYVNRY